MDVDVGGVLVVVVAVMVGMGTYADQVDRDAAFRATHTQVDAVLIADAPITFGDTATMPDVRVLGRWTGPDGTVHQEAVRARPGSYSGTHVNVWVGADGRQADAPATGVETVLLSVLAAWFVMITGVVALIGCWAVVRRMTEARNLRRWEREWARIGPTWGGTAA